MDWFLLWFFSAFWEMKSMNEDLSRSCTVRFVSLCSLALNCMIRLPYMEQKLSLNSVGDSYMPTLMTFPRSTLTLPTNLF